MKPLVLAALMLFSFHSTSVLASVCRVIEYAELKDTSTENVVKTFCQYKAKMWVEAEHVKRLRDAGTHEKDMAQRFQSIQACVDMLDKIRSALRNRSESDEPNCQVSK